MALHAILRDVRVCLRPATEAYICLLPVHRRQSLILCLNAGTSVRLLKVQRRAARRFTADNLCECWQDGCSRLACRGIGGGSSSRGGGKRIVWLHGALPSAIHAFPPTQLLNVAQESG